MAKRDTQIVGNIGMYYVCYRMSELGWNVMPTARNARGIDVVAYSPDGSRFIGVQVKTLSKRSAVPLGERLDRVMGDFWCIVVKQADGSWAVYVMTPEEVRRGADVNGDGSCWLSPGKYALDTYRERWDRMAFTEEE